MIQAKEEARKAAIDNINAYKEEQALLEEQAEKYKEITEALEKENLSVDETVAKKEELLGIQNTLVDTFGDEAEGIDLVNGKYKEQLELLDSLSKGNAKNFVAENKDEFEDAKDEIKKIRKYNVGKIAVWSDGHDLSDKQKELVDYIRSYSDLFKITTNNVSGGGQTSYWDTLTVKADVEDADKVLRNFAEDLRKFGDENDIDVSGILSDVGKQLNNTWTDELKEYKQIYDEYSTSLIMANDDVRPKYKEAIDAVEKYNKAIATGEGYETAKTKLREVMSEVESLTAGIQDGEEMWRVFQDIFNNREKSRESRVADLKEHFGLNYNDKTLETFFANENVDIERFEKIAEVCDNAVEAIRMYKTEVANDPDDTPLISQEALDNAKNYQSELKELYDVLALFRSGEVTPTAINDLIQKFPELSEHMDNISGGIEELIEKKLEKLREVFDGAINEEALRRLAEYTVKQEAVASSIQSTTDALNNLVSAYKNVSDAMEQYNQSGFISLELLESIMSMKPEYLGALLDEWNNMENATDAYKAYMKVRLADYIATARQQSNDDRREFLAQYYEDGNRAKYDENVEKSMDALAAKEKFVTGILENFDQWFGSVTSTGSSSTESVLDWVEIKINSITEAIEKLKAIADDPFASWNKRGSELQNAVSKTKELLDVYEKAKKVYETRANEIGLDPEYVTAIKEGAFRIDDVPEDISADTYKKIQEYQELWDKIKGIDSSIIDTNRSLNEYTQDNFDLIISEFDAKISHFENTASMIEAKLANAESRGLIATKQYYETLKGIESGKKNLLEQQLADLTKALDGTNFETDSEGWSNLTSEIESTEIAIQESTNAIQEFNNEIRQIDWDLFDFARDQESKFMNEADFMIDLLDSAKMFSEAGEITAEGMATMGLHAQNYNAYLEQSIDYAKELASLQEIYGEDTIDANVIERRNELLELQQESILSAEAEKDAMIDLVSEGIELQKEAFQGLIDEYTEALDVQKDLYEYNKKNSEQTKKIADLQKRLISLQGDNSDEARAERQRIQGELKTEKESLQEQQYDRYISDQKEILSTISEDYNTALDAYLDDTAKVISDSIDAANRNASNIGKTLTNATNDVGYDVKYAWNDEKGILATNFEDVEKNILSNNNVLGEIKDNNKILIEAQQNAIVGELNKLTGNESPLSHLGGIKSVLVEISTKIDGIKTGGSNDSSASGETDLGSTPQPTSGEGNGKKPEVNTGNFSKGATLTKVTGKWFESSDGTGASGSTTPKGGADSWTIDKINEGSKYPYHIMSYKNGKFTGSGWVKKNQLAYKNGTKKVGYDQVAWTQEDGLEYIIRPSDGAILTPVAQNDMVLNAEASKRLWEVSNNPMQFIKDNMSTSIPNAPSNGNSNIENNIQMTITLPGVSNYQEFVTKLQSDKKFERMIVDVTSSALTGSNSLSKYRHQF